MRNAKQVTGTSRRHITGVLLHDTDLLDPLTYAIAIATSKMIKTSAETFACNHHLAAELAPSSPELTQSKAP